LKRLPNGRLLKEATMSFRHLSICLLLVVLPLAPSRLAAEELPAWTSIGPDGGNVQALAVSPAFPNWVLAGTQQGYGIFRSADRANSWGPATEAFGRNVLGLAIDAKGGAFYAATNLGLLKSMDGGVLWPALDTSSAYTLVATHPRKAAIVFAVRAGVLLRSTNGGVTRNIVKGLEGVAAVAFALVGKRTVVYAGAGNGFWRSTDDGRTWTDQSPRFPFPPHIEAIAVHPGNPQVLYIGLQDDRRVLFKSLNGGATWRLSQRGLPTVEGTLPTVSELAVDRTNPSIVYAVAGGELFRSVNGGRDWSRPVPQLPGGFVNALEATGYGVLAGTPAGVLLSSDRGATWQSRIAGLATTSISEMAIDAQEPPRLYVSNVVSNVPLGFFKTANRGRPWLRLGAPPGSPPTSVGPLVIDPADPNIVHALFYAGTGGGIAKSTNGGRSWTAPLSSPCLFLRRIALDPREPAHLFATSYISDPFHCEVSICSFFRSLDAGETWQCLGDFLSDIYGDALLGVDPFTSAVYAQVFGDLRRSTDNGVTWTSPSSEHLLADSFAASPLVAGTLWAGKAGGVSRSRDGGTTWQFFSIGLPSGEKVIDLAPDPAEPATLYAATRRNGVFKSTDAGETWSLAGLWPAGVEYQGGLLIDPGKPAIVYAGTNGLSVLRLDQSEN
jgi:photosystem II stability/assembly factor-like uncharacterized protein